MLNDFFSENTLNKKSEDKITDASFAAGMFRRKYPEKPLVDGTIGIYRTEGNAVFTFSAVEEVFRSFRLETISPYSFMSPTPEFTRGILAIGGLESKGDRISVFPQAGGLNALHTFIHLFASHDAAICSLSPYWSPYDNIVQEIGYRITPITIFDENDPNVISVDMTINSLRKLNSDKIILILNQPAQNPTGLTLTGEELDLLARALAELKAKGKKIALFLDSVYVDFSPFRLSDLLERFEAIAPFFFSISLSKSLSLYGFRGGALCMYGGTEDDAVSFREKCAFTARATTGSINHAAYAVITHAGTSQFMINVRKEQNEIREAMNRRKDTFTQLLGKYGCIWYRYDYGFFITFRHTSIDSTQLNKWFVENGVFFVPMGEWFRAGICSLPLSIIQTFDDIMRTCPYK